MEYHLVQSGIEGDLTGYPTQVGWLERASSCKTAANKLLQVVYVLHGHELWKYPGRNRELERAATILFVDSSSAGGYKPRPAKFKVEMKMTTVFETIVNLFGAVVTNEPTTGITVTNAAYAQYGFIPLFAPTQAQLSQLKTIFKPLPVNTLFTVEERKNNSIEQLLTKQILHYIDTYGLGNDDSFGLKQRNGTTTVVKIVRPITQNELGEAIRKLLYSNAPIADVPAIKAVIDEYAIRIDINQVRNNEARVALFVPSRDVFASGDDAVRYLCFRATNEYMLIKSAAVIAKVKAFASANNMAGFLEAHKLPLSNVFNRHKPLILAMKTKANSSVINAITRLSKTNHVPVGQSFGVTFVSQCANADRVVLEQKARKLLSARDCFKILNYIAVQRAQLTTKPVYAIRNGKLHLADKVKRHDKQTLNTAEQIVFSVLGEKFAHLRGKTIVLDRSVDYGLPISRKQTVGNLPYGTLVSPLANDGCEYALSAGICWYEKDGARDLDLSAIDENGTRVGWGSYYGYSNSDTLPVYSGDVTSARDGAMEFMTNPSTKFKGSYGVFVNIFSGNDNSQCEVVVGKKSDTHWIDTCVIREKITLESGSMLVGVVRGNQFLVVKGRLNNSSVSSPKQNAMYQRYMVPTLTVKELLVEIGANIVFETAVDAYADLSYASFTYDKLEKLFNL